MIMIFKTITLYNLFSYYGKIVFHLNTPEKGKNIVLITGRNGHGKTSFINSVKLLFSGVSEELRSGIPGSSSSKLSLKQYLLGSRDLWAGVFNRKAKKKGQKRFYIKIEWEEKAGIVEATREWRITGKNEYQQHFRIDSTFMETVLKDQEAQDFLDERLPQDYIPFFYFDSEQIHKMIDISQNNLQKHMERLLNISQIETAREYIGKALSDWKKAAMVEKEKASLQEMENALYEKKSSIAENKEKATYLKDEIFELEDEIEETSKRLDRLRENSQIGDEKKLKKERDHIEKSIEELTLSIADDLTDDTPLLFNSEIIIKAAAFIKIILESDAGTQSDLINSFIRTLPINLFDSPPFPDPSLSEYQTDFYRKRLIQLLEAYKPVHDNQKSLFFIEKKRASLISDMIAPYLNVDHRKKTLAESLKKINNNKNRAVEIELRLDDIPGLTQQEREEFEGTKKELSQKSEIKGKKEGEIKEIGEKIQSFESEIKKITKDIKYQEKQVRISGSAKNKVDLSNKLKSFFKAYKDELKKKRRKEIESKLDTYSKKLITSNTQIEKIEVYDDFSLHPVDKSGTSIGINSLSSGIRQLIATALLWSLKDVSGKTVPLVIDTPLGRIDKEHQENLLNYYYPSVGKQVIILPTDSELDLNKYKLLQPYICQEFQLRNSDGESTEYVEEPMYKTSSKALNHG
jgi:DNA sulfur modification protein DndD